MREERFFKNQENADSFHWTCIKREGGGPMWPWASQYLVRTPHGPPHTCINKTSNYLFSTPDPASEAQRKDLRSVGFLSNLCHLVGQSNFSWKNSRFIKINRRSCWWNVLTVFLILSTNENIHLWQKRIREERQIFYFS